MPTAQVWAAHSDVLPKSAVGGGAGRVTLAVEKPDKHDLSQVIKVESDQSSR